METNSTSIKSWYRGFKAQHLFACLFDLGFWVAFLLLVQKGLEHYFTFQKQNTPTLITLIALALLADRLMTLWGFQMIWTFLKGEDPNASGKVASDLIQDKGYYPNPAFKEAAIENFGEHNRLPTYPWYATCFRKPWRSILWILGIVPILLIDQYQPPPPESHQIIITATPPEYLQEEPKKLKPGQDKVDVFPGTLISINIPKHIGIQKLQDEKGRLYLPRYEDNRTLFDIRVMGNVHFKTEKNDLLKVTTLIDEHPIVEWVDPPQKLEFKPLECQFISSDDFGIKETLITVNGTELEYAGDPLGKQLFDYRWTFDPQEHLPLMGGNVVLQITAYDNDTINGPKHTRSQALIWEFPGIENLTKDSIQELDKLIADNQNRLTQQPKAPNSQKLSEQMEKFSENIKNNPALSQEISPIMNMILNEYKRLNLNPKASKENPGLLEGEKEQLTRNQDYYEFFKSALENILHTIQKAEMVSDLMEAAEQSRQGNPPNVDFFKDMFDKISEMTQKGAISPQEGQEMMNQINQADIAASLGEKEMAAEIMEKLAENLRQSQQGAPQNNPLAQKFQELMQELGGLIQDENSLLSDLNKSKQAQQSEFFKWKQAIQKQKIKSAQTEAFQAYQEYTQAIQNPNLTKEQESELLSRLGNPEDLAFQGLRLTEMFSQISSLQAKPEQLKRIQPLLEALNETLNEDLRWPEELFTPPKTQHHQDLSKMAQEQQEIGKRGQDFAKDFRMSLSPVLPSETFFRLADQAGQSAQQAGNELMHRQSRSELNMKQAKQLWEALQRLLQQMQQQGQGQGSQGQSQPRLSIGKDGKLQLQQDNMMGQQEGDGPYRHRKEDMDIPLPEDFQHTRHIEDRLRKELLDAPQGEKRDRFQEYMLDLLE